MWHKSLGIAIIVGVLSSCSEQILGSDSKEHGEGNEQTGVKQGYFFDKNSMEFPQTVGNYIEIPVEIVCEDVEPNEWFLEWADRAYMDYNIEEQKIRLYFSQSDIGECSKKLYLYQSDPSEESSPVDSIEVSFSVVDSKVDLFKYSMGNEWVFEGVDYVGSSYGARSSLFTDTATVVAMTSDSVTIERVRNTITTKSGDYLYAPDAKELDTLYEIDTISYSLGQSLFINNDNRKSLLETRQRYNDDSSLGYYEQISGMVEEKIILKKDIGLAGYYGIEELGNHGYHSSYSLQLKSFNGTAVTVPALTW